jgi:ATP synthase F1 complex assembly factor 2
MTSTESQAEETVIPIQWMLFGVSDFVLCGLDAAAQTSKSLVIPLALYHRKLSIEDALRACRVEENYQLENYGEVEGFHDLDKVDIETRLSSAALFLHLLSEK